MVRSVDRVDKVGIMVPSGMLGAGFDLATIERGLTLDPAVIAVDGGSTDSGPHYLGTGKAKTAAAAVSRDLRILLRAAASAGIPLIVGSCGTSGTDSGVDWVADMVEAILTEEHLDLEVATIYSEQSAASLKEQHNAGRILPLEPATVLSAETLEDCTHIVGMMGHEPIVEALRRRRGSRRPGHRYRGRGGGATDARHALRTDMARSQDRRVWRPVHHEPAGRRCVRHH
jgi:hypothetical protein